MSQGRKNVPILSCKGLGSLATVREHVETQTDEFGKKRFYCRFAPLPYTCSYNTCNSVEMAKHVNLKHIGFVFPCHKCGRNFRSPTFFREHWKNHECGFGFEHEEKAFECRGVQLCKYRSNVEINGKKFYRCGFQLEPGKECGRVMRWHMAIKRHIHAHTCPFRAKANEASERPLDLSANSFSCQ